MSFSPELAEIRFGYGLSPMLAPPASAGAMLKALSGPDAIAARFPIETAEAFERRAAAAAEISREKKKVRGTDRFDELDAQYREINKAARVDRGVWAGQTFLRRAHTRDAFRERLVAFWADHFTALGKVGILRSAVSPYAEGIIRPNVTGRFADLLIAAVTSPLMIHYLDQGASVGPNSKIAKRGGRQKGLNENLAREVLELHTLGVGGPYTQDDVRQLAELFTGLAYRPGKGFVFRKGAAEPGSETVLGRTYGGNPPSLDAVLDVLKDLAVHPATARHIATKLAVHFLSDDPDPALVGQLETRFLETDGDLMAVYAAMLEHPSVWDATLHNVKPPIDFVSSSFRALAIPPNAFDDQKLRDIRLNLFVPLSIMGQDWQSPTGPDGWAEEDEAWLTPQGLSARMRWAMAAPQVLRSDLPDPRAFVDDALGSRATEPVRFAAAAAESRSEAIGLVLSSPAFQRR